LKNIKINRYKHNKKKGSKEKQNYEVPEKNGTNFTHFNENYPITLWSRGEGFYIFHACFRKIRLAKPVWYAQIIYLNYYEEVEEI